MSLCASERSLVRAAVAGATAGATSTAAGKRCRTAAGAQRSTKGRLHPTSYILHHRGRRIETRV